MRSRLALSVVLGCGSALAACSSDGPAEPGDITPIIVYRIGSDLYRAAPDGSGIDPFALDGSHEVPRISQDGRRVAYFRLDSAIVIRSIDGSFAHGIANVPGTHQWIGSLDPDGDRVIIHRQSDGGPVTSLVRDVSGDTEVIPIAQFVEPDWSPDGGRVLFNDNDNFRIAQASGWGVSSTIDLRALFPDRLAGLTKSGSWSRDGQQLALTVFTRSGVSPDDIVIIDADGRNPRRLNLELYEISRPSWSFDGRTLLFSADPSFAASTILHTYDLQRGTLTPLPIQGRNPMWARAP